MSVAPGTLVANDYRVISAMAQGGMGEVYLVEQVSTGKRRALKLMKPELLSDPALVQRFEQEARIGGRIESDHIVEVVGAGVDRALGMPWLAMELLQGESLAAMLVRRRFLPPGEARLLFAQIGHGLAAAHQAGVVHRDLKPENIFVARVQQLGVDFKVKILDFGIAKLFDDAKSSNTGMMSLGTPRYMAPEQTGGQPITPATDVWALGLIAFQVLTGHHYWRRATGGPNDSVMTLLREVLFEPLVPASRRAAEYNAAQLVPEGFDAWFVRCVAREPSERFQNAADAHAALDPVLGRAAATVSGPALQTQSGSASPQVAAPSSPPRLIPTAPARKKQQAGSRLAVGLTVGALLAGSAAAGGYYAYSQRAKDKKAKRDRDSDDDDRKARRKKSGEDDGRSRVDPPTAEPKPPPPPPPVDRAGKYTIVSANSPGTSRQYSGTLAMTPLGSGYRVVWSTGFVGTVIESDGLVVGAWGPDPHAPAIYKVDGGKLTGRYVDGKTGTLNTHTLEGPAGLNGSYTITASSENDTGTVTIRPTGQAYALVATLANESLIGTGVLTGDRLAVGWSAARATSGGVISYQVFGKSLKGVWTFHRGTDFGTENIERD